jgi:hypothetical protein
VIPGYSWLRSDLIATLAPFAAIAAGSIVSASWSARYLWRRVRRVALFPLGSRGTTELEFALAFPFFLMTCLVTVQSALLMNATLIVDYAAFTAARSAAVWLPQDQPGEGAYVIAADAESRSPKWTRIHNAATIACVPISPRATGVLAALGLAGGAAAFNVGDIASLASFAGQGAVEFTRLTLEMVDRVPYASLATTVDLETDDGRAQRQFAAGGTVKARVTHRFYMNVPFAGAALGAVLGRRFIVFAGFGIGPYYVPVSSAYTLQVAQG